MRLSRSTSRPRSVAADLRVLGIDPSLTSSGWACRVDGEIARGVIDTGKLRGPRRLDYAANQLEKLLDRFQPDLIAYEDYAMGGSPATGRVFDIGELGGVFKRMLWVRGIDVLLVPPTVLKKALSGKGNAGWARGKKASTKDKKQPIVDGLFTNFGISVQQYDEADAIGLMLLGEFKCGANTYPQNAVISARFAAADLSNLVAGKLKSIAKTTLAA